MRAYEYLQLSSSSVHVCESKGKRLKSMLHAAVTVTLGNEKQRVSGSMYAAPRHQVEFAGQNPSKCRYGGSFLSSPEAIQHMTIREDPQHDVVSGGVMDERPLRVDKEHIGHPYLLHQAPVKGHALVGGAWEGQPLILPVVPQIQGHGEVLRERGEG